MTELTLNNFLKFGKVSDAIKIMEECKDKKIPNIGVVLGKFFRKVFPKNPDILFKLSTFAFDIKNYALSYDIAIELRDMITCDESFFKLLSHNISLCIPHIADRYVEYNSELVEKLVNRQQSPLPMVTFTITTCKRYDLFEKTINSFLNCCTDLDKIDRWFCVDDNSSEEDRDKMKKKYPFFDFYFKSFAEKGHPQSMNIIREKITTPYIFHIEDDWKFFDKRNYISLCMEVLSQSEKIGQCLVNKNYSETEKDVNVIGGLMKTTSSGKRFFIHEYCRSIEDYNNFYKKNGHGLNYAYWNHYCSSKEEYNDISKKNGSGINSAYWKHFSFRPSLIKKHIIDDLGSYNEKISHFESEYSERYIQAGYISTFLDGIYSLHIGRLTSERFDETKQNAYILNDEKQFADKELSLVTNNFNNKTYVINLNRRPDRWENFEKNDAPKFLLYQRFSAIDGSNLIPNDQLQRIFEGNDYQMRQGMVGCAMSHIKLWVELINSSYNSFCILEDDIEFVPDFKEKFLNVYNNLPKNWDVCFLGHFLWNGFKSPEWFDKEIMPNVEKWTVKQSLEYSMGGTIGYIVSKKGARKLLDFINTVGMKNCIDTMMQKACDICDVYYCKPQLVYSECCTSEKNVDTDIQVNFNSLNLTRPVIIEYPERLKKNGVFNIEDALLEKQSRYLISCSETTHTSEAIKTFSSQKREFPFDLTDGGTMDDFAKIIMEVCSLKTNMEILKFVREFCLNNEYKITFPHEKVSEKELVMKYYQKFENLRNCILSGEHVVIVHVSRWKKTETKIFQDLLKFIQQFNSKNSIITVNGLNKDIKIDTCNIYPNYLEFPDKFIDESWNNQEQIFYDQRTFRVELITLLQNCISKL